MTTKERETVNILVGVTDTGHVILNINGASEALVLTPTWAKQLAGELLYYASEATKAKQVQQ